MRRGTGDTRLDTGDDAGDAVRGTVAAPLLLHLVVPGVVDPTRFVTRQDPPTDATEADEPFDRREEGWCKAELLVAHPVRA